MSTPHHFRVALLTGGAQSSRDAVMPHLLACSEALVIADSVHELLALPTERFPEIVFICGMEGLNGAELLHSADSGLQLVLLAPDDAATLRTALAAGVHELLPPSFDATVFTAVYAHCCQRAALHRREIRQRQQQHALAELAAASPVAHLCVSATGTISCYNEAAALLLGLSSDASNDFHEIVLRFFLPHGTTYPHELESALLNRQEWHGVLDGRDRQQTCSYRIQALPLHDDAALLIMHDVSTTLDELARLRVALQGARDCLLLTALAGDADLPALATTTCRIPLNQAPFTLDSLLAGLPAETSVPSYLPQQYLGDTMRLSLILKALISGSSDFAGAPPRLSVAIKERTATGMAIQFAIHAPQSSVTCESYQSVADYLATADPAAPAAATGLGLAALLTEQLHGTLLVRSERGRGRTLCCTVPLAFGEGAAPLQQPVASSSAVYADVPAAVTSLKILVVEDNLLEQTALRHQLESLGCTPLIVGNGREAVDEFENGEFDLILMDILMPLMDGFEATRLIRERERITGSSTPVVALTSYSMKAIQDKCLSVGMNGYLAKPVARKKLIETLLQYSPAPEQSAEEERISGELCELPLLEAREVLENLDFDLELYRELVTMYLTDYAGRGDALCLLLESGSLKEIETAAHELKGIAANIGARRLAETCNRLQNLSREGEQPEAQVWRSIVTTQTTALNRALEQLDWSILERFVTENTAGMAQ